MTIRNLEELDRLVRFHLAEALRFAVRLVGDEELAEELLQESLYRVARRWKQCSGPEQFRGWLYQIVLNVTRDHSRQQRMPTADSEPVDRRRTSPSTRLETQEVQQQIDHEVRRLPPRQREVFVLLVTEGFQAEEVGRMLEMNVGNVYSTLHQAKARLRERLLPLLQERDS